MTVLRRARHQTELDAGAERHKARVSAPRDLEKKRERVAELERLVAATEAELGELRGKLGDAPGDDWEALHEWAKKEQTVARRLDEQMKDFRSSEELQAREAAEANG